LYRLCWCAGGDKLGSDQRNESALPGAELCKSGGLDISVDVGALLLQGVAPLVQDFTCVSGQTCLMDSVIGVQLHAQDALLILDTCAGGWIDEAVSGPLRPELPASELNGPELPGFTLSASGSGATVSWGSGPMIFDGGRYRLCWCAAAEHTCSTAEQFVVDFGSLLLLGPQVRSLARTCVSGQHCRFNGILGADLLNGSVLLALDTCGQSYLVPRFGMGTVLETSPGLDGTAYWGDLHVTAAGGEYRLCWCASLAVAFCSSEDDFVVDVGRLDLVGVAPLEQRHTCVSGQSCALDGILGTGMEAPYGGHFQVLDTCALSSAGMIHLGSLLSEGGRQPSILGTYTSLAVEATTG
jgi:hypothetical protein